METDSKIHFKRPANDRLVWAGVCVVLAFLAIFSPKWPGNTIEHYLGELLVWAGLLEMYDGFRRNSRPSKISAQAGGALSLLMGALLINGDLFQSKALYVFVTAVFAVDAVRHFASFYRGYRNNRRSWFELVAGASNILLPLMALFLPGTASVWTLAVAVSIRMVATALALLSASTGVLDQVNVDVVASLGLTSEPYVNSLAEKIKREEEQSALFDRRWIVIFIVVLFFIHLGRMGLDRSFLGLLSPLVATAGDIVFALVITYAILAPLRYVFLMLFRKRSQRLWKWIMQVDEKDRKIISVRSLAAFWLTTRIRAEMRYTKAAYSFSTAVRTGLKIGLPWSAVLAAIMPVLGMSWYFDTENWASGIWDKWAATRADEWRMAMTRNSGEGFGAAAFELHPQGVDNGADFSFVVVGDPGEGDASQLVLKDQIIAVSNHPEVKFVVISSDVIYPTGALKDYERKFWMPFKGVTKPVYAIPGNHDWYDALEGFVATFFEPEAARRAMVARVNQDLKLTSTTESRIAEMISTTERWRKEYEVPTGFQKAPYFQVATENFVLITIETGVVRQIDSLQRRWLTNVLEASKGKFVMALLGHPFYAAGEYQGVMNPDFESIHRLLRKYKVPLVMAGDTHDLEYYMEPGVNGDGHVMRHFVNGGGGAYLSIGAAMATSMPTQDFAFYPPREPLVKKIGENTAWYKRPAWWWTLRLNGWPFSAEWLSAMFDYNVSPYFQSFMEIKVEGSRGRVTLIPYSNHGRIRWSDMTSTAGARPEGARMEDFAEWVIPIR